MSDVSVTLVGDTLVLATEDYEAAKLALKAVAEHARISSSVGHVWIVREESVEVVWGYELETEEIRELFDEGLSEEERDRILDKDYVRYDGSVYPLSDFSADWGITRGMGLPGWMRGWHSYLSDSFFSGLVLRYNTPDAVDMFGDEPDFTGESGVTIATFITG